MTERSLIILLRSVALGAAVAVSAAALAFMLARVSRGRSSKAVPFALMLTLIPACIGTQGWVFLFDNLRIPFSGIPAVYFISVMYYLPLCLAVITLGLRTLDAREQDAAEVFAAQPKRFAAITFPQTRHIVFFAFLLTFLLFFSDFSIPSVFAVNVSALDMLSQYSVRGSMSDMMACAWPACLVSLCAAAAGYGSFKRLVLKRENEVPAGKKSSIPVTLALCFLCVPIVYLLFCLPEPRRVFDVSMDSLKELSSTFTFSALAAVIAVALAAPLAFFMSRRGGLPAYILAVLPLAVPAPVISTGVLTLFLHTPLYGTALLPALALAFRFMPFAAAVIFFVYKSRDSSANDARRVFQKSPARGFVFVTVPSLIPAALLGALCVFILSAGEISITLMLSPPGMTPLVLKTYNLLHYGAGDLVASVCLLLLLAVACVLAAAWLVYAAAKKVGGSHAS